MAAAKKRKSDKQKDSLRAKQVYKQVALHQSDKEILTLKQLFIKYAKNTKGSSKKKDDEKEVNMEDYILSHKGLLKVFKYCGIIQIEEDKEKQKKLFKHFDLDENGEIDYDEVLSNMHAMGMYYIYIYIFIYIDLLAAMIIIIFSEWR